MERRVEEDRDCAHRGARRHGLAADQYWKYDKEQARKALFAVFGSESTSRGPSEIALDRDPARAPVMPETMRRETFATTGDPGVTVERIKPVARHKGAGAHFTRFESAALGFQGSMAVTAPQYTAVGRFRSIAAGDVDDDGWQDLYVANGEYLTTMRESNVFYRNDGTGTFKDATKDFGLRSFLPTSGYVYVDWDQDGDLDIVTTPVPGPVLACRNDGSKGNSIAVELRDHRGNRFGIGSKVIAHMAGGKKQMRELQASGGFVSFDPPTAHFGLGTVESVEKLEIAWSTGGTSTINGPFPANSSYVVTRDPRP